MTIKKLVIINQYKVCVSTSVFTSEIIINYKRCIKSESQCKMREGNCEHEE